MTAPKLSANEASHANNTRRICRTPEEAFQAGWDDGADDPPLTERQRNLIAALLGPHIRAVALAAPQANDAERAGAA